MSVQAFDVVIDATGSSQGVLLALAMVQCMGTIVLKSTCSLKDPEQPQWSAIANDLVVNEKRLIGSRCGAILCLPLSWLHLPSGPSVYSAPFSSVFFFLLSLHVPCVLIFAYRTVCFLPWCSSRLCGFMHLEYCWQSFVCADGCRKANTRCVAATGLVLTRGQAPLSQHLPTGDKQWAHRV